jgi:hypothetical protein
VGHTALTTGTTLVLSALERLKQTRWFLVGAPILFIIGLTLAPNPNGASWWIWIGGGLAIGTSIGVLWILCRRIGWAILPGLITAIVILGEVETALSHPFPGHTLGSGLGIVAVFALAVFWTRSFKKRV